MADEDVRRSNDAGVDDMTIAQLKEELRGRKLKVSGNKVDLVARLKAALVLENQHEEDNDDEYDDESKDEHDEAGADDVRGNEASRRSKFVPTFKDVEESIDTFSGDDGKDVKLWIKKFEDMARLCEWNKIQVTIYAKRLLRASARLFVKADDCGKTWKMMKAALKAEFALKVDSRAIHRELQARKKKPTNRITNIATRWRR